MKNQNVCPDCGLPASHHTEKWIDAFVSPVAGSRLASCLPASVERVTGNLLEDFFRRLGVLKFVDDFALSDIPTRSACFVEEAHKCGIKIFAIQGPVGLTNSFRMVVNGKHYGFEGLPVAEFKNTTPLSVLDDKSKTKRKLARGKFPVLDSRSFWFFQKRAALEYGIRTLGFPLVVKPRNGTFGRHITTGITSAEGLKAAINKAIAYSPVFVVEKYLDNAPVHRATVIDSNFVACVKRVAPNVVGDGVHTIRQLIDFKNAEPNRGELDEEDVTLYKIVEDEITDALLEDQNVSKDSVPAKGQFVYLQKDPFIRLGADLDEVTDQVHPDNLELFRDIAEYFGVKVAGLDFLIPNITQSWKQQPCAVLELNSVPCIEVHHFPSRGRPQNVGRAIVEMVLKYY